MSPPHSKITATATAIGPAPNTPGIQCRDGDCKIPGEGSINEFQPGPEVTIDQYRAYLEGMQVAQQIYCPPPPEDFQNPRYTYDRKDLSQFRIFLKTLKFYHDEGQCKASREFDFLRMSLLLYLLEKQMPDKNNGNYPMIGLTFQKKQAFCEAQGGYLLVKEQAQLVPRDDKPAKNGAPLARAGNSGKKISSGFFSNEGFRCALPVPTKIAKK